VEREVSKDPDKLTQADGATCAFHAVKLQEDDYAKDWDITKFFTHLSLSYKTAREKTRKMTPMATATIMMMMMMMWQWCGGDNDSVALAVPLG
jgi:hypothetical protein